MEQPNEKAVVFLPWSTIEPEARQQILNTARMPFVFKHVAVMPDCHYGRGATVGTVLPIMSAWMGNSRWPRSMSTASITCFGRP